MSDRPGLSESDLKVIRAILEQIVSGRDVRVFGSRAGSDSKPWSDLDLLVLGDPLPLAVLAALRDAFAESDLAYRVDVVEADSLSEELRTRWIASAVQIAPAGEGDRLGMSP